MRDALAAFAALLLGLCFPQAPLSLPSLALMLAALTVLPAITSGRVLQGVPGLPGWNEVGGEP